MPLKPKTLNLNKLTAKAPNNFLLVLLSTPFFFEGEDEILTRLFEAGLSHFHLRKPEATLLETQLLVERIPAMYHNRIVLHQHFELCQRFELKGIHLKETDKDNWDNNAAKYKVISAAFHATAALLQLGLAQQLHYAILSPIFNSISKRNTLGAFDHKELGAFIKHHEARLPRLVALGGVTADSLGTIQSLGFKGAACIGAVWDATDPVLSYLALRKAAGQAFTPPFTA